MSRDLKVNMIACSGHGLCADLLPEMVQLDEWGYPIIASRPVPPELMPLARRAVRICPELALRLEESAHAHGRAR